MASIPRLVRKSTPTLLEESKGNEVIDAINALMSSEGKGGITVKVDDEGKLEISTAFEAGDGIKITSEDEDSLKIELSDLIQVKLCINGSPVTGKIAFVQ